MAVDDTTSFAIGVCAVAGAGLLAVLSSRVTQRLRVPAAALFLVVAAAAAHLIGSVHAPAERTVERLVTVALVVLLFDGGAHLGLRRVRDAAVPVAMVGVVGTFLTAVAVASLTHLVTGFGWYASLLVGTAVAPTDPAVVFSVLGRKEIAGRSGTILEAESGANDPVGIALMVSLLAVGHLSAGAAGDVTLRFVEQMVIGVTLGVVGAAATHYALRRVGLPSDSLYALLVLASIQLLFGVTTLAHGSGFLAVFTAGILLGDERAPFKTEIVRFHSALASLGEIVAFVVLGLTVDVGEIGHRDVWVPGLVLGLGLAVAVRPVLVALCLVGSGLPRAERVFVMLVGLKGAVPILLGLQLLGSGIEVRDRAYAIVVVIVVVSVVVQGGLVPTLARWLAIPMRVRPVEPWSYGVRLTEEPQNTRRITVEARSPAEGRSIEDLHELGSAWISFIVRTGQLVPAHAGTVLHSGDELFLIVDDADDASDRCFRAPPA